MLRLVNVTKSFGTLNAVDHVSLEIPQGQMVGIIGSSGAGKSTLLRLINRLWEPSSGKVMFYEEEVSAYKGQALLDWRSNCAMIFQQFNLVKRLTVLTNVLMGRLRKHGTVPSILMFFTKKERAMAVAALDRVNIVDQALKRCDQLSGGQQQRVAIARALMQDPLIILADEPIASLDPASATRIMDTLRSINQQEGHTVIASLHHLSSARAYCERIIGMKDGQIVFDGTPFQLSSEIVRSIYDVKDAEEELEHDAENLAVASV